MSYGDYNLGQTLLRADKEYVALKFESSRQTVQCRDCVIAGFKCFGEVNRFQETFAITILNFIEEAKRSARRAFFRQGGCDNPSVTQLEAYELSLRSYVTRPPKNDAADKKTRGRNWHHSPKEARQRPSDWVLTFDCETAVTPDQKLKFGNYQLRHKGRLFERGIFYEADALLPEELAVLRTHHDNDIPSEDGEKITFLARHEFVEQVFFAKGYNIGAQFVGFNLPFDISRLAVRHTDARDSMKGGFSFVLIDDKKWPTVSVKHLSQRTSFIHFTGIRPKPESDDAVSEDAPDVDRGYFVDVKTLAAALQSESHSLESLSKLLKVPHPKLSTDSHGEIINPDYVRYALRDVQATWECFDVLNRQLESLDLHDTGPYELYSEASLGKAYLKVMGVKPWRDVQPDFSPERTGQIMSTYFGGRSEVHIRREITEVIHTDFLSMYPTVCTLMGLWNFVIANGIQETNDTEAVKQFVARCTPETMRSNSVWKKLTAIVQVLPNGDLFPVRAHYAGDEQVTIGLNYLTSDEPMWFTLADVLVSKFLTGKAPNILQAIRFSPKGQQANLNPVSVAGRPIHPTRDDFYKSLIEHRLDIKDRIKTAIDDEKPRLDSDSQAIKILANATSYGIFVELNVKDYRLRNEFLAFGPRGSAAPINSKKFEDPGRYFHPLLGTLTTGAARLMLALAERQVMDQGLDWAFCDTDSLAIANNAKLPRAEFLEKALAVQAWFAKLNPYGRAESILQLEKVNFPKGDTSDISRIDPLYCLTVSAKRYVLFNRDSEGHRIVRKASGHGLGHLLPPYNETPEAHRDRIKKIGVPLWQEDVWRSIIAAIDAGTPDQVPYRKLKNFTEPAASRYAATTTELLGWFDGYNGTCKGMVEKPYYEQVKPFNFLLSLQAKSRVEMAASDAGALKSDPLWHKREPHPAAPYDKVIKKAITDAFDRDISEPTHIPRSWLKSYARSLARYHLHPEAKFLGGNFDERGTLRRRHVHVLAFQQIGKEADNLEEREFIGDSDDEIIEHDLERKDRIKLRAVVLNTQKALQISDREICERAKVSHHTLAALRVRKRVPDATLRKIAHAVEAMRQERLARESDDSFWISELEWKKKEFGSDEALADFLGVNRSHVTRMRNGKRAMTEAVKRKLKQ